MKRYKRIFVIVLDSLGIGAMPDSPEYGDVGVDTFGHILQSAGPLSIPHLRRLGMLNLHPCPQMDSDPAPAGRFMRMAEASRSKDTMTGHWEMMGLRVEKPFKTFTEHGFPPELIGELENTKRGTYGGAIGYIDFAGNMDTCIAIRIAYKKGGKVFVRSGAGIVADSVPEKEYEECINKAKAVVNAMKRAKEADL